MKKEIELKKEDFGAKYSGKYTFESITWGESNRITGDCTTMNPVTRSSTIDMKRLQALMLDATLKEKPKSISLQVLLSENSSEGLSPALGELLMSIADKVNGFSFEDREKLKKLKEQWNLE